MAQWYNFTHTEAYDPEIRVGLYDQWLLQVSFGPTQRDRAVVHTSMLETAFERRFVFSELGRDISGFEAKHTECIGYALKQLEGYLPRQASGQKQKLRRRAQCAREGLDLIGLAPLPSETNFNDTFPASQFEASAVDDIEDKLRLLQREPSLSMVEHVDDGTFMTPLVDDAIVADDESTGSDALDEMLEALRKSKPSPWKSVGAPRQLAAKRLRKSDPIRRRSRSPEDKREG